MKQIEIFFGFILALCLFSNQICCVPVPAGDDEHRTGSSRDSGGSSRRDRARLRETEQNIKNIHDTNLRIISQLHELSQNQPPSNLQHTTPSLNYTQVPQIQVSLREAREAQLSEQQRQNLLAIQQQLLQQQGEWGAQRAMTPRNHTTSLLHPIDPQMAAAPPHGMSYYPAYGYHVPPSHSTEVHWPQSSQYGQFPASQRDRQIPHQPMYPAYGQYAPLTNVSQSSHFPTYHYGVPQAAPPGWGQGSQGPHPPSEQQQWPSSALPQAASATPRERVREPSEQIANLALHASIRTIVGKNRTKQIFWKILEDMKKAYLARNKGKTIEELSQGFQEFQQEMKSVIRQECSNNKDLLKEMNNEQAGIDLCAQIVKNKYLVDKPLESVEAIVGGVSLRDYAQDYAAVKQYLEEQVGELSKKEKFRLQHHYYAHYQLANYLRAQQGQALIKREKWLHDVAADILRGRQGLGSDIKLTDKHLISEQSQEGGARPLVIREGGRPTRERVDLSSKGKGKEKVKGKGKRRDITPESSSSSDEVALTLHRASGTSSTGRERTTPPVSTSASMHEATTPNLELGLGTGSGADAEQEPGSLMSLDRGEGEQSVRRRRRRRRGDDEQQH